MRILFLFVLLLPSASVVSLGNHPESTVCSPEKPYQAICTHSLHNLEGWYGKCYAIEETAQRDADKHAREQHDGNTRWTGIKKARFSGKSGY